MHNYTESYKITTFHCTSFHFSSLYETNLVTA